MSNVDGAFCLLPHRFFIFFNIVIILEIAKSIKDQVQAPLEDRFRLFIINHNVVVKFFVVTEHRFDNSALASTCVGSF